MVINKLNINKFIDGTTMDCSSRSITHIEYIPDHITRLYCSYNQLTQLPKLPESLIDLYCNSNKLTSLPKLPESLTYLDCEDNNLPYPITLDNLKEHNNRIKLSNRSKIINKILCG